MPNYCDFSMHIKGQKKDVFKLAEWLSADYSYSSTPNIYVEREGVKIPTEHHIGWRVFECYYQEDAFANLPIDSNITLYLSGYCAWSVYSSMMEGPFTYYTDNHADMMKARGEDLSLTLPQACKKLSVEVELFSNEPGMCFSEHYHIGSDGKIKLEEETEYIEFYIEEYHSYDDYVKSIDGEIPITKEEFDDAVSKGNSCVVKCKWLKDDDWPFKVV